MSLTDKRTYRRSGILPDLYKGNRLRREEINTIRNYDNSTPWIEIGTTGAPAFQNSWINYSSGSDGNHRAAFMRDAAGIVHLRGLIKTGAIGSAAFTLPIGFRPNVSPGFSLGYIRFACVSNGLFGSCRVDKDGLILPEVGSSTWFDLAPVQFPAEL
jgi:hypothetical protein